MSANSSRCPKAFVLGHPIKHSKSPALHRAAYRVLGEPFLYERRETLQSELAAVFQEHGPHDGTRGFSVTMPLKTEVLKHLDALTPFAHSIGVVNTVYWRFDCQQYRSWGHNTDVSGIVNALRATGFTASAQNPAIVGGGGTATAALAALAYLGAEKVRVFVRDEQRASALKEVASRLDVGLHFTPIQDFAQQYHRFDLVVCTLPPRAADHLLEKAAFENSAGVLLDVSYDPWPSALARFWEASGGAVTSGLEMLMYQAIDQVKLFTGGKLDERLPRELQVINEMCAAVGLPPRTALPEMVWDAAKLGPQS